MTDEQNAADQLYQLMRALNEAGVHFVVCGGVACVLHGVERATYDLDIAVSFEPLNLEKLLSVANRFQLIPRIPEPVEHLLSEDHRRRWVEEKGALVYTFVASEGPLQMDIFLRYPKEWPELLKNAVHMEMGDCEIAVSSIADLLDVKKAIEPPRRKDLIDIEELERLRGGQS